MPKDGGLDVADWIADGIPEDVMEGVLDANPFEDSDSNPDPEPVVTGVDEWDLVLQNLVDPEHPCFERNPIKGDQGQHLCGAAEGQSHAGSGEAEAAAEAEGPHRRPLGEGCRWW